MVWIVQFHHDANRIKSKTIEKHKYIKWGFNELSCHKPKNTDKSIKKFYFEKVSRQ